MKRSCLSAALGIALLLVTCVLSAAAIPVEFVSFDDLIAGESGNPGVNAVTFGNLTGDPGSGGLALPLYFPVITDLIFLNATRATPFNLFLPSNQPSVRVVSVAGAPVPPSPTGSFTVPDVVINSSAGIPFTIEARSIPVGTIVKLQILSENDADQTVDASPLAGTPLLSTSSASAILPPGFSRGFVRATWVQ